MVLEEKTASGEFSFYSTYVTSGKRLETTPSSELNL